MSLCVLAVVCCLHVGAVAPAPALPPEEQCASNGQCSDATTTSLIQTQRSVQRQVDSDATLPDLDIPDKVTARGHVTNKLLEKTWPWSTTILAQPQHISKKPDHPHYADADCRHFRSQPAPGAGMLSVDKGSIRDSCKRPRVLIFTWCTEDQLTKFLNEAYWKSCYAKAHGFDIEFSGTRNVTGLPTATDTTASSREYYSDQNMWPWVQPLRAHLTSGKYDYVFFTGSDVLFTERHLNFPVWAYDDGHDITVMDQETWDWGYNENGILFKASSWSVDFLDVMYEHRHVSNLQGDNGPFMETILTSLGSEQAAEGRRGYDQTCHSLLVLDKPSAYVIKHDRNKYALLNNLYSACFWKELDRLAGPYGQRLSKHIGFTSMQKSLPWANCFYLIQTNHADFKEKCFALHFNGIPKPEGETEVHGKCPDPTFNWETAPYNVQNPNRPAYRSGTPPGV